MLTQNQQRGAGTNSGVLPVHPNRNLFYGIVCTLHCQQYCWVSALETLHYVYDAIAVSYRVCFVLTEGPSCNMTQFLCDNGTCISGSLYCDGVDNCGDGSDDRRSGKMIIKKNYDNL